MSAPPGLFAGKLAFGSTLDGGPAPYLTTVLVKESGAPRHMPEMAAAAVSGAERCILYRGPDGTHAVQLGGLLWVGLNEDVGWLVAVADVANAARLTLAGSPVGTTWQVATSSGLQDVWYSTGRAGSVLSINGGDAKAFAPQVLTPSLDAIRAAGGHPGADLDDVDLRGLDLTGLDLSGASLARALLDGAKLTASTLTRAVFDRAVVGSATFDGATLDDASFDGATLTDAAWGRPKSARRIVLTGCAARGATLGDASVALDCAGAALAGGDFRGADLRKLKLAGATGAGVLLSGAKLDGATLDGADLSGAVAVGASLVGASLRGTIARGASFVRADLSSADLTRVQMGARAWLFALAPSFATDLDTKRYAQPALVAAFATGGVTISPEDVVTVVAAGARWQVVDHAGPYDLALGASGVIDVFSASPDLRPASLRGARCLQTKAPSASLSGADLRGVNWSAAPATLDHADLSDASLAGSYLVSTSFTQAYLDGADMSSCVLVQSDISGAVVGAGAAGRPLSLEGSLLQGAVFRDSLLLGALLVDAAVAVPRGVPLFTLPLSAAAQLTTEGLPSLATLFAQAGRPLGTGATVRKVAQWLLDDSANPDREMPRTYRVAPAQGQLAVYDAAGGGALLTLASSYTPMLSAATASAALCSGFAQGGYTLAAAAPITAQAYWAVAAGTGGGGSGAAAYPGMRVFTEAAALPVYGSVLVALRDWPAAGTVAFGPTQALDTAMSAQALGPSGVPRAWVDSGLATWEQLVTAAPGAP